MIWVTRVSWPLRTKECLTSSAPMNLELASEVSMRSQAYSSMRMRAVLIGSCEVTKCPGEVDAELFGGLDAVLLGEGVRRVLGGVRRQDVRVETE